MIGRTNAIFKKAPEPAPQIGDIVYLAEQKCMCIGENRYISLVFDNYNFQKEGWDYAMNDARSHGGGISDIERKYTVSNLTLISRDEVSNLPINKAQYILDEIKAKYPSEVAQIVWTCDEYEGSQSKAWSFTVVNGGSGPFINFNSHNKTNSYYSTVAFTIVSKK